ncbi:hypothetical protein ETD83_23830 [Actinomadura soli]|uniref:Uncharacterized protein n=1 Tax=Actinomadura soli TaxID=2508997 RepID=A0A5C4J886_9ACTN|nr:hypothetical protein [Actinomadura soli]TMQ94550.1 hypothetical protein ETD83_23830 [Actinomadura soli]
MGHQEFYTTIAQVFPVLLLALLWDSQYLENLRTRPRPSRREDPVNGVWFWTKNRVRIYIFTVSLTIVTGLGAAVSVLAGILPDSAPLRFLLVGSLFLILVTLVVRIWVEVTHASRPRA